MKNKISIGVIGLGQRGFIYDGKVPGLTYTLAKMDDVEIAAVCDVYPDRVENAVAALKKERGIEVFGTTDYKEILNDPKIDAVAIFCSWEMHVPIAVDAMRAGKAVALEVGGAYSVEDCWKLVKAQEETGVFFMMLENCCYDRNELLVLNMVREGLFGEIVHCSGCYGHDLRKEISEGEKNRHYRYRNYLNRNCDNYPTHELGPIAKILNINRGNKMTSLVSFSSKAAGLNEYNRGLYGDEHPAAKAEFMQGDIVTTMIKCAHGETITLTLDTTLPRPYYSRGLTVRGTKGMFTEDTKSIVVEEKPSLEQNEELKITDNVEEYRERYGSPLWKEYDELKIEAGHGGMDWHVMRAFVECYKNGWQSPIDVYDAAAWMAVTALSEQSIARGGAIVEIPDFTSGKEIKTVRHKYSI